MKVINNELVQLDNLTSADIVELMNEITVLTTPIGAVYVTLHQFLTLPAEYRRRF